MFSKLVLIVSVFIMLRFRKTRHAFFLVFLGILMFEGCVGLMLAYPILAQIGPLTFLRNIYMNSYRTVIQDEDSYARYDPYLKYTLRPGKFIFANPEFRNEFRVNRLGVRDDAASLNAPGIVVVGDSIPMGWGVNQNETFAQVLEKKTGMTTLNAGVSSYGTIEAMRMVNNIDTSAMKYLVVFYEDWKYPENMAYFTLKGSFTPIDESTYSDAKTLYRESKRYYPGKYAWLAYGMIREALLTQLHILPQEVRDIPPIKEQAEAFMYTLTTGSEKDLSAMRIIVICDADFVRPLQDVMASEYPMWQHSVRVLPAIKITGNYAYILDDHPKAAWHTETAKQIIREMNQYWHESFML